MDNIKAIPQIKANLALTSSRLAESAAPLASLSLQTAGVPLTVPKASVPAGRSKKGVPAQVSVPASELDEAGVPAAHALSAAAASIAKSVPVTAIVASRFGAVPAR